jgi:[2-(trimethylamino)ethyl]phosphonate dioxygenase
MATTVVSRVAAQSNVLRVEWQDGRVHEFASVWLRDNVRGQRDVQNGQRLVDIADLPAAPAIRRVIAEEAAVRVEWEDNVPAALFAFDWLAEHAQPAQWSRPERQVHVWSEAKTLDALRDFAWLPYTALAADSNEKLDWLTRLLQSGMAFIHEVPATEQGILQAVGHIGRVNETNYGRVFDVRTVPKPDNLAYSDLGLGLHTDNPYREPVPGFQALHALVTSPDGGESLFADGFALAQHLRAASTRDFDILAATAVPFHYSSADADLYAERPLIQLRCDGEVGAVHYNNRSIAPFPATDRRAEPFYSSYRVFAQLLREERFQMRFRLRDGDLVVFDNQRIMHGRTAFTSAKHPRHLRGCYLTRDSVFSETGLLRRRLQGDARR